MVMRHLYDGGRPSGWFFPLRWVDGAAGGFWPAEQRGEFPGYTYMVPKTSGVLVSSLCMPFCNLNKWGGARGCLVVPRPGRGGVEVPVGRQPR